MKYESPKGLEIYSFGFSAFRFISLFAFTTLEYFDFGDITSPCLAGVSSCPKFELPKVCGKAEHDNRWTTSDSFHGCRAVNFWISFICDLLFRPSPIVAYCNDEPG
jgi:hypothetical protein